MSSITNLVPIRVDASSSDGAVRIIDTLLVDTTCLPVSHAHPRHADGNSSGLNSLSAGSDKTYNNFSLSSLVDSNAAHFTESILADAEVYGAVRSSRAWMGGRLDLLKDTKLYGEIENQIRKQLSIALSVDKKDLILPHPTPDGTVSSSDNGSQITSAEERKIVSKIVRIKLRLRHENVLVMDEFDYDVNTSGMEGSDPFSIANSLVGDLKLPPELAPDIAASIGELLSSQHCIGMVPVIFIKC